MFVNGFVLSLNLLYAPLLHVKITIIKITCVYTSQC